MFSYPGARHKQHRKQTKAPPSSIRNNPREWFEHFDVDNSGSLSQEEIIRGLYSTFNIKTAQEQQIIRDSIFNTWCVFDVDNSGTIDKREFLMSGGMAESLIAMEQQRNNSGHYGGGAGGGYPNAHAPPPPQRGNHYQPQQPYQPPPPQQQQTQLMRIPIPQGMRTGQQLRVRSPGSGELVTVTIPSSDRWVPNAGQYCFDIHVPVKPPVVVQGTPVGQSFAPPAYAPHRNNYASPQQQQQQQLPWTSYNSFHSTSYNMPPLGMQRVSHNVPSPTVSPNGRRKALLIGINYKGTKAELRGCVNDVKSMKDLLIRNGFRDDPTSMCVLVDDHRTAGLRPNDSPTKSNIQKACNWLVHNVSSGDVLFFHFSGHGAQVPDKSGMESDGFNETICPVDYSKAGQIVDDELWGRLVYKVPSGVRLTAVMDCCHSGTGLDLPYDYNIRSHRWQEDTNPAHSQGDTVLFSGCEDSQTSADVMDKYKAGGAMTNAFLAAYNGQEPFPKFLENLHYHLKKRGFKQRPQLTSSQQFDINRIFNITQGQICGNDNVEIGRSKRRHIKPGKANNGGMNDFLLQGAGILGAFALAGAIFD